MTEVDRYGENRLTWRLHGTPAESSVWQRSTLHQRALTRSSAQKGRAQAFLWDARSPGLGLRATSSGAKSYIFQAKLHGVTIRLTIGTHEVGLFRQLRKKGESCKPWWIRDWTLGEHKAEQQAAHTARRAEARRREVTMGEAWDVYVAARKPRWRVALSRSCSTCGNWRIAASSVEAVDAGRPTGFSKTAAPRRTDKRALGGLARRGLQNDRPPQLWRSDCYAVSSIGLPTYRTTVDKCRWTHAHLGLLRMRYRERVPKRVMCFSESS